MLHRQEPAMMHQGEVQTLCEVTMKYFGPSLILPRDQRDPTQEVEIEQQHCGGNTLPVFKERIKPGGKINFINCGCIYMFLNHSPYSIILSNDVTKLERCQLVQYSFKGAIVILIDWV